MPAPLIPILARLIAGVGVRGAGAAAARSTAASTIATGGRSAAGASAAAGSGSAPTATAVRTSQPRFSLVDWLANRHEQRANQKPLMQRMLGGEAGESPIKSLLRGLQTAQTKKPTASDLAKMPGLSPSEMMKFMGDPQMLAKAQDAARERQFMERQSSESQQRLSDAADEASASLFGLAKKALTGFGLVMLPRLMGRHAQAVLEQNRPMENLNSLQAVAFGRLEMERFRRDVKQAGSTSASVAGLAQSVNQFEENTKAVRELSTNLKNLLASGIAQAASRLVQPLENIARAANRWLDIDPQNGVQPTRAFIDALGRGDYIVPKQDALPPPPRFGANPGGL